MAKRRQGLSPKKAAREQRRRDRRREKLCFGPVRPAIDYKRREVALRALGFHSYEAYLASPLWRGIRAQVLERDDYRCQLCPAPARSVHHNSYSPETLRGENLADLASLCKDCHEAVEFTEAGTKRKGNQVAMEFARRRRLVRGRGLVHGAVD